MKGLDPTAKAARLANYIVTLRKEVMQLCHACGVDHPGKISPEFFEILRPDFGANTLADRFDSCIPQNALLQEQRQLYQLEHH
jgi:hypothetical protein